MAYRMPIGVDNFQEIREKNYYFVDKTNFIRQLIDGHSKVTLLTRPRRFGKTLTMSMVECFFSIEKEKESQNWFAGLDIDKAGTSYMAKRGKYPVLFLSLKDFSDSNWQSMVTSWKEYLTNLFLQHVNLCDTKRVQPERIKSFQRIVKKEENQSEMAYALALLLKMLHQYYGRPAILLIDEYDAPIQKAWANGFYKECISFMRTMLGSVLKSNADVDFALLTGVLRVSKESIFSGLNNLDVYSVLSNIYADVMGFTSQEVQKIAADLQMEEYLPELKRWYDGYHFGKQEIYNPWSVMNAFHRQEMSDYWVNTSGNDILKALLAKADVRRIKALRGLLEGKTIATIINEQFVYDNIYKNAGALYALLLMTGYLTTASASMIIRNQYELQIPNQEVRDVYTAEILDNLAPEVSQNNFADLFVALFHGDGETFAEELQEILQSVVSVYDAANKESFYHGFMLGMTALFLDKQYVTESNRESGYGRFDLAIFPQDTAKTGVIMEFKAAQSAEELSAKAQEALEQIEQREYITEFNKRGIQNVWKYGIAFYGKQVAVVVE